jgi:hypothetical protein
VGWHTDSTISESRELKLDENITITIRAYGNPGEEKSYGLPYCLLFVYDSLPRSITLVIDVRGLDRDDYVKVERIIATQDSPFTRHTLGTVILPLKNGSKNQLSQTDGLGSVPKATSDLHDSVYRLSHNLTHSITGEGHVDLDFSVSTNRGSDKTEASIPHPIKLTIQQKQNFYIVFGWQSLLYSEL